MTTAYTPEPGSLAARVCTWLQRNHEEELTPRDIATKFDVPVQGLHFTLRDAMAHGWVLRSAVNGAYAAGPRLPIAGAPSGEPAKPAPHPGSRRSRRLRHRTPTTATRRSAATIRPTSASWPSSPACPFPSAPPFLAAACTPSCSAA
jgi:hypothetical protein